MLFTIIYNNKVSSSIFSNIYVDCISHCWLFVTTFVHETLGSCFMKEIIHFLLFHLSTSDCFKPKPEFIVSKCCINNILVWCIALLYEFQAFDIHEKFTEREPFSMLFPWVNSIIPFPYSSNLVVILHCKSSPV